MKLQELKTGFKKGFTLIELMVVIVLMCIVSSGVYFSFTSLNNRQILDKEIAQVKSYIQKARMNSLNSKNGDVHGVLFSTTTVTVIELLATSTRYVYVLNDRIRLTSSTLGTSTLTFSRISGLPNATGTLTYTYGLGDDVVGTSTLTINGAGIVQ